jgi:hypothetical protein
LIESSETPGSERTRRSLVTTRAYVPDGMGTASTAFGTNLGVLTGCIDGGTESAGDGSGDGSRVASASGDGDGGADVAPGTALQPASTSTTGASTRNLTDQRIEAPRDGVRDMTLKAPTCHAAAQCNCHDPATPPGLVRSNGPIRVLNDQHERGAP